MARNDLRARGAWGGRDAPHQLGVGVARRATPIASISIYIKISCLSVGLSSDVMTSCRHEVCCRHVCYDDDVIKSI